MAINRRTLIAGTGTVAAVGAGYAVYRQAPPFFWKQLYNDISRSIPAAAHRPTPELWPDRGLHVAWLLANALAAAATIEIGAGIAIA